MENVLNVGRLIRVISNCIDLLYRHSSCYKIDLYVSEAKSRLVRADRQNIT